MSEHGKEDVSKTPNLPLSARALLSRQRITGVMSGPGRLPSLRPARDLSLGATPKLNLQGKLANSKRTFTPTIPARRTKEEPKEKDSTSQKDGKVRNQRGEGQGRGRGRGRGNRGKPEIVKSQSVFSMGPADKSKTGQSTSSVSFTGGDRRESKTSKTTIKKEKNFECDDDESKRILEMLQTEDDDTENECTESGMAPVSIPLSSFSLRIKETVDNKNLLVKEEPMDIDMEDSEMKIPMKPKPMVQKVSIKTENIPPTCSSLFSSTSESIEDKLIFIQLPDKLPIKLTNPAAAQNKSGSEGESADENSEKSIEDKLIFIQLPDKLPIKLTNPAAAQNKSGSEGESADENSEKTKGVENPNLSLKDVSEGYIGKLQILKSGKTRLVLGDVTLDVAMGTSCSFLQELVTVHTEEDRSDVTVLGQVKHRIICTPDFEQLLIAS